MRTIDPDKFANTILYLIRGCGDDPPGTTKLVKMLYFADFMHYRKHLQPITGATYVALERGPVPRGYDELLKNLVRNGVVRQQEVTLEGVPRPKIEFHANRDVEAGVFEKSELDVLEQILAECRNKSGRALSDASHLEGPWSWVWDADNPGHPIPYALARWAENTCDEDDLARAAASIARPAVRARLAELSLIA